MTQFIKKHYEELDITKGELKQIGDALKKEEFRNLLNDYVEEVNDPKNKAIFEKELIQLEKERGVDATFVHPSPGYVIKSSVDGEQKAFINICSNEHVGKPLSDVQMKDGTYGRDWSIPYIQAPPRIDIDKKGGKCIIFDVVFHPDTLKLAKNSVPFKDLVNDTALSAVEDAFKTKLDRKNLKFPKSQFKGPKVPTIIRKKIKDIPDNREVPLDIPNYPYQQLEVDHVPKITNPRANVKEYDHSVYTEPKYIIKHRKGVDYNEFTYGLDSKINAALPTELTIEIDLPLLKCAGDATLDVCKKSLTLISHKPAKYKLEIKLPYPVNEENGSAKFDKKTKKLVVTLPVELQKITLSELSRYDSGIESDLNPNRSSSDEDLSPTVELNSSEVLNSEPAENYELRTSEEILKEFLSEDIHYSFPPFSLNTDNRCVSIVVNVKNIDPSSVAHQYVLENSGVHIKFTSLGSGFFPVHYAYCLQFEKCTINTNSLKVEVWDNNLIIHLKIDKCLESILKTYLCGQNTGSMQVRNLSKPIFFERDSTSEFESLEKEKLVIEESKSKFGQLRLLRDSNNEEKTENISQDKGKKNQIKEETTADTLAMLCPQISNLKLTTNGNNEDSFDNKRVKSRTCSESNLPSEPPASSRRSILKTSRSLSESNTDEYTTWSSLDSSDNPDESGNPGAKKTVRFSNIISKKVFRANSSILGQKHRNEKKYRNRKKVAERRRRYSESTTGETSEASCSDVSDYSEVSDHSEVSDVSSDDASTPLVAGIPSSKKHRRRGSKNGRKNAATAKQNNFLLQSE